MVVLSLAPPTRLHCRRAGGRFRNPCAIRGKTPQNATFEAGLARTVFNMLHKRLPGVIRNEAAGAARGNFEE
jgi:hypothetical protein